MSTHDRAIETEPGAHGLTAEQIAEWTRRSRERQGLPPKITDPIILARVYTLAFGAADRRE
jgi:hypothetical protein